MKRGERNALSSFQRIQEFLAKNPLSDVSVSFGAQAKELDDVITSMSTDTVDQEAGRRFVRAHAESHRMLRQTLYTDHMRPISLVAREAFGLSGMDVAPFHGILPPVE